MLRRRHHAQAQIARAPEGRQEAHETGRQGGDSSGSVSCGAESLAAGLPMASEKVNKVKDQTVMENSTEVKTKSTFREYTEAILMALVLALFIRTFIVQAFKIPSGSMIPTLQIGDHILVNKLSYGLRMPFLEHYLVQYANVQRGDVVVFIYPEDRSKDFIKRVRSEERRVGK